MKPMTTKTASHLGSGRVAAPAVGTGMHLAVACARHGLLARTSSTRTQAVATRTVAPAFRTGVPAYLIDQESRPPREAQALP